MRRFASLILVCALMASCFGRKPAQGPGEAAPKSTAFPTVTAPGIITDPAEVTTWIAEHFFDDVTTVTSLDSTSLEQAVGTWASLLTAIPPEKGGEAVKGYLKRLEKLSVEEAVKLNDLVEKYIYDPNSPVRNEDLYATLAKGLSTSKFTPDSLRTHYAYLAEKCALNAVGTKAADFLFTQNGRVRSLYSVEAEKLLLVFGNPECTACRELHESLAQMEDISEVVTVLEINPDEDSVAKMETDKFYHIRAIPSMYLLDADKTVLLKDAPVERILRALQQINQNQAI